MRLSLIARKLYRLLKSGSPHSADYKKYAHYLNSGVASYQRPFFNITIDFELAWSRARRKRGCTTMQESLARGTLARQNLPTFLSLLDTYHIPATFAVVGHVALARCGQHQTPPPFAPAWTGDWYAIDPRSDIAVNPNYYGVDLIKRVLASGQHEIGSHSFSHVDLADEATGKQIAEFEIKESRHALETLENSIDTFVFPNNRPAYNDLLVKHNFTIYRSNKNERMTRDQFGLWQFPLGIWTSPKAFSQREAITLVNMGIRGKTIVNFWLHLYEFKNPAALKQFFEPLFAHIAQQRDASLIFPATMRTITHTIANYE